MSVGTNKNNQIGPIYKPVPFCIKKAVRMFHIMLSDGRSNHNRTHSKGFLSLLCLGFVSRSELQYIRLSVPH